MTIILRERATGTPLVLVGTGFGAFASSTPGLVLGSLAPRENKGTFSMVAVTGPRGGVTWYPSEALIVDRVDGFAPGDILHHQRKVGTVVQHQQSGVYYLLLGTGFGAFATARPGLIMGNQMPIEKRGEYAMVCLCDATGAIGWMPSDAVKVLQVHGQTLNEALAAAGF